MLCVSVKSDNVEEICDITTKYPFVEVRLDDFRFSSVELHRIFSKCTCIATCRNSIISDKEKVELLLSAMDFGANVVDIEIDFPLKERLLEHAAKRNVEVIASVHYLNGEPETDEIIRMAKIAKSMNAKYFKVVCRVNSPEKAASVLYMYMEPKLIELFDGNMIALPMGKDVGYQRFMALNMGAPFIYTAIDEEHATAEGQTTYEVAEKWLKEKIEHDHEHHHHDEDVRRSR